MRTLLAGALLGALTLPVAAQADCRANFGGLYAFSYSGYVPIPEALHIDGLAYFYFYPDGTYTLFGSTNAEGNNQPYPEDTPPGTRWYWQDDQGKCVIYIGDTHSGLTGIISSDGNQIVMAVFLAPDGVTKTYQAGVAVKTDY